MKAEKKFSQFKINLKSLEGKFMSPEEIRTAKFHLATFEDLIDLANDLLDSKLGSSTKNIISKIKEVLSEKSEALVGEGLLAVPILTLAQIENRYGSYLTDKIRDNYCEAKGIGRLKKIFFGSKIKDEALKDYLHGISRSRVNELGEPLSHEEIDQMVALRKNNEDSAAV
ncbi:MAG: hypothetical protein NT165_02615 [Candidatus Falkowbacteria bacterium]|nr:hypothetical protein [Candidatus Falkowbacteria bacterium]